MPNRRHAERPPTALAVIEKTEKLTKAENTIVNEALRRGETTRNEVEHALVEYGRWLLGHVFGDDAKAALNARRENNVWRVLLRRAGGPTLRLTPRFLHVAIAIAAHDKRIQDDAWRLLEPARKELLLPLAEEDALREAAQHVVAMKLSHNATRSYVKSLRAEKGRAVQRRVSLKQLEGKLRAFRERVSDAGFRKGVTKAVAGAKAEQRAALRKELSALGVWVRTTLASTR